MTKLKLGAKIKELRKAKGLSQSEIADIINIDAKHLSRIEVGANYPSLDTLTKLAEALEVPLKELFEFGSNMNSTGKHHETLNKLMKQATEEELKIGIKILKAIIKKD
jgi:transcriptional regulator with XRE-family HTH domain